jgi:predicted enzyme related to lactoylglutathione lyase
MSAPASNTVAWFEIGAPDVDAAKAFYGQLFSWSFAPDGAYAHHRPRRRRPLRRDL